MSVLDVNTPRGQETVRDEERAVAMFEQHFPGYRYMHTDKATIAKLDGLVLRKDRLVGVVLTSCRYDCTLDTFEKNWNWEWLVTWRKLQIGAVLSRHLQTPLVGFLYVVNDRTLLVQKLYNPLDQKWCTPIRVDRTPTRATTNDPRRVLRWNAFIKIDRATRVLP